MQPACWAAALTALRRARLETIRAVLLALDYEGRDLDAIGKADPLIAGAGPEFFTP